MYHIKLLLRKILPNSFVGFLRKLKNGNYLYILWLFPVKQNKVVFSNYFGKGYGDSAKYILENLLKKREDLDIVWLLKNGINPDSGPDSVFSDQIRIVRYGSFKSIYELATAKVWIDNTRKVLSPPKRTPQYYIQTWHSPLRLKKIEKDAIDKLSDSYIQRAQTDSKNCDLMISGCDFSENIYKNSFWYNGEIIKSGTPRCDLFFSDKLDLKKKVYRYFNLPVDTKFILYAPTFRLNNVFDPTEFNASSILQAAENRFGGKWKILLRLHPNISDQSGMIESENFINASFYDDMQELLYASEILITDYSSCMFDMLIAGKKCFIYANDYREYIERERDLYFNIKELPFYFSETEKELEMAIKNFDVEEYQAKLHLFNKVVNLYEDGHASDRIVSKIEEFLNT